MSAAIDLKPCTDDDVISEQEAGEGSGLENHYCLVRWCFGEMRNLLHICSLCWSVIVLLEDIVIVGR